GGIIGKVASIRDDDLEVEIAPGVKVRVVRSTISQVLGKTEPVAANK
ncbi:MAG TPA: preprotein translocase subunit YajC, partial [Paracoccus sp.]|nr:preprotein translocase subunit YajC [Paracoccus sp. (in: a-proteobacteria)]